MEPASAGPLHSLADVARVYELLSTAAAPGSASTASMDTPPALPAPSRPRSRSSTPAAPAPFLPPFSGGLEALPAPAPAGPPPSYTHLHSSLTAQHSSFIHIMASRLTETRSVGSMWTSPSSTLAGYLAAFKFMHTSAHESVAVDVLHAAAACSGVRMAVSVQDVPDSPLASHGDASTVQVELVGGLPLWSAVSFPVIAWVHPLCTVLESILYSNYEDYLTTGATVVGHMMDALTPLFKSGARCSEADLSALHAAGAADEDDSASDDSKLDDDEDEEYSTLPRPARRALRHVIARQCVDATRSSFPLLAALAHGAAYGGRCAKLMAPRVVRLRSLHDSVRHLVAAAAFAPVLPGARYDGAGSRRPARRGDDAVVASDTPLDGEDDRKSE